MVLEFLRCWGSGRLIVLCSRLGCVLVLDSGFATGLL